jgi:hypothetical protein
MNAVVARAGSSRSARAASARVAAAASSEVAPSTGTYTCTPFDPLVLTAPARPASTSACRTSNAAATARPNGPPSGGSISRITCVGWCISPASTKVGWYSTARWLANHSSVRQSSHSAYRTSRRDDSAHSVTNRIHGGA